MAFAARMPARGPGQGGGELGSLLFAEAGSGSAEVVTGSGLGAVDA